MRITIQRTIVGKAVNAVAKIRLLQNLDFARRLASNAFECAATYSWSNTARKIDSIYQRLVPGV